MKDKKKLVKKSYSNLIQSDVYQFLFMYVNCHKINIKLVWDIFTIQRNGQKFLHDVSIEVKPKTIEICELQVEISMVAKSYMVEISDHNFFLKRYFMYNCK